MNKPIERYPIKKIRASGRITSSGERIFLTPKQQIVNSNPKRTGLIIVFTKCLKLI
jgi:hypothetical protein